MEKVEEILKLLIVDSCAQTRQLFKEQFLDESVKILEASDGSDGWEIFKETFPHVVVSEIDLPNLNGYQLARKISSICSEQGRSTLSISFSTKDEGCDPYWAIKNGFAVVVSKRNEGIDKLKEVINNFFLRKICSEIKEQ